MSEEIMWLDRSAPSKAVHDADVRVSRSSKLNQIAFTFYNDADKKITHNGTMILGLSDRAFYFKEGVPNVQGNIVKAGKRSSVVRFTVKQPLDDEFFGQFKLTLHAGHNLWRINIDNRVGD